MATSAPGIEKHTLLGPFFRISPLQPEVTREYFAGPKTMDRRHIHTSQEALRLTLQAHQRDLLDIVNRFVRASPESRNKILDWFAYIVNSNHMRRALRPDATQLSSDGFLMNITVVLDGLCDPFMDATFSKVEKIDIDYLKRQPRVDIKDETKLNADQNASDEYYKEEISGTSNFISEVFFLTLAAHHYGSEATNGMLKTLDKDIKFLTDKIGLLEAERPKFANVCTTKSILIRNSWQHSNPLTTFRARRIWHDLRSNLRGLMMSWRNPCHSSSLLRASC
jgi:ubiquitin conjugation factor E4 B